MTVAASLDPALRVAGLTIMSLLVSGVVAVVYRWYVRDRVPGGITLLAGVSSVALSLTTGGALGQVAAGETSFLSLEAVAFNTLAFVFAGLVTAVGRSAGDRLALSVMAMAGSRVIEGEMSALVSAVGRLVAVHLPEQIHDIGGYDPASDEVKAALAGKTLLFPRAGDRSALETRLRARLKDDYDVGYVDVELAADGTVEYLALGRRVAGIGPTLAPGAAAVAVEADPANAASAGDAVQVWETDGTPARVATAEVRGVAGDVVTIALDEQLARTVAGNEYRLVTLPGTKTAEREFAGLLRAAEETMAAIRISPESDLVETPLREVGASVVAVKPEAGPIEPIPPRSRPFAAGETMYVVASPATIRQLETRAGGPADAGT